MAVYFFHRVLAVASIHLSLSLHQFTFEFLVTTGRGECFYHRSAQLVSFQTTLGFVLFRQTPYIDIPEQSGCC